MSESATRYLSLSDIAERIGVVYGTVQGYSSRGLLPDPDVLVGLGDHPIRGWSAETIDTWNANRPGPGRWKSART